MQPGLFPEPPATEIPEAKPKLDYATLQERLDQQLAENDFLKIEMIENEAMFDKELS